MVPRCERGRSTTPPAGSPRQHPARPPRRRALTPGRAGTRARARGSSRSRRAAGPVPSPGCAGRRSAVVRHSRGAGRARQARPELQQGHVVLGVERFQGGLGLCFGYMAVGGPHPAYRASGPSLRRQRRPAVHAGCTDLEARRGRTARQVFLLPAASVWWRRSGESARDIPTRLLPDGDDGSEFSRLAIPL